MPEPSGGDSFVPTISVTLPWDLLEGMGVETADFEVNLSSLIEGFLAAEELYDVDVKITWAREV